MRRRAGGRRGNTGKILLWAGGAVLLALLVAGVGFGRLVRGPSPASGALRLEGLEGPVDVLRDSLGVPHIWASSVADAFFAQGYLHASDRLWQMELFRRVAQGRLSELFGEATVEADRFLRTLGLARAAMKSREVLNPETRTLTEAYARGVNAAVAVRSGLPPPEFVLLRSSFEPWEEAHTLAMEKIMAWDLSEYETSILLAEARALVGDEAVRELLPRYPEWGVTILQDAGARGGRASRDPGPPDDLPPPVSAALASSARIPEVARALLSVASTVRASNSWVVGGARSRSGKPVLAGDMHLGLDHPNIWYLIGMHAPGLDVVGQSLPGAPGVISGHTGGVAWAFTNATADDSDLFIERVDPADPARYLTPEGSERFRVREEVIRVRGRDEAIRMTVRETRRGPVITPVEDRAGGELLSYRWTAHDPSTTFTALLAMNRASTAGELVRALARFTSPHQNTVFADTAGVFGYQLAGEIPLRRTGRPPILPVPGWTGEHDWAGTLPFPENPHLLAPESGYVVTANNRQSRDSLALLVSSEGWEPPHRAGRIVELIESRSLHDRESFRGIQLDVTSGFVARYRGYATGAFRRAGLDSVAAELDAWDGRMTLESTEATLFHTWVETLRARLRARFYEGRRAVGYFPRYMVERTLESGGAQVDSLATSAARAAARVRGQRWGEAHLLDLGHPLAEVPVAGRLFGFGRRDIPRAGGPYTVDAARFSGSAPPFRVRHGASQRAVINLADLQSGGSFILPGGQSGLPSNRHSWDQLERWQRGELWRLPLAREQVEARTVSRLRLLPGELSEPPSAG